MEHLEKNPYKANGTNRDPPLFTFYLLILFTYLKITQAVFTEDKRNHFHMGLQPVYANECLNGIDGT